jgi:hypothetical protein
MSSERGTEMQRQARWITGLAIVETVLAACVVGIWLAHPDASPEELFNMCLPLYWAMVGALIGAQIPGLLRRG